MNQPEAKISQTVEYFVNVLWMFCEYVLFVFFVLYTEIATSDVIQVDREVK